MCAGRRDGRIGTIEHTDGTGLLFSTMDEALAFECLQMLADGAWRAKTGGPANFANGGGVTGVAGERRHVFKDLLLTIG
jgi:hypothetical protein